MPRIIKKEVVVFKNRHFRVVLDVYTPRPHFILLYNEGGRKKKYRTIYDFPNSLWQSLIKTLHKSFRRFGPCIFSVHLGFYQSKDSPYFHAHYYVPFKKFFDLYVKAYQDEDYLRNLFKFEERIRLEGEKYKSQDLKQITDLKPSNKDLPKLTKNYSIKFHDSQPRVSFHHNSKGPDHNSIADLVLAMMEFIYYYELHDRTKGACHLCIQNKMFIDEDYEDVIGYVQIDIRNYYKICPNRKKWLKNFRKEDYIVLT